MTKPDQAAHATTHQRYRLSLREKDEHKQRVLTQGAPSVTGSIANAVVVKNGNLFFLTDPAGIVPLGGNHGFGLYYNDCRYLSGYGSVANNPDIRSSMLIDWPNSIITGGCSDQIQSVQMETLSIRDHPSLRALVFTL